MAITSRCKAAAGVSGFQRQWLQRARAASVCHVVLLGEVSATSCCSDIIKQGDRATGILSERSRIRAPVHNMDINHSKSIFDQVDEYLHDTEYDDSGYAKHNHRNNNYSNNSTIVNSSNNSNSNSNSDSVNANVNRDTWLTDSMQMDLDHLNDTIFNNHNHSHDANTHTNRDGIINNHHDTNARMDEDPHHDILETLNTIPIPTDLMFSPSASPMIGPNQASTVGMQVTPFMNPQQPIISHSNANTPFLGASSSLLDANYNSNNNNNNNINYHHNKISGLSPLTSPALIDEHNRDKNNNNLATSNNNNNNNNNNSANSQVNTFTNSFTLPSSAVVPLTKTPSSTSGNNGSPSIRIKKKHSISGQPSNSTINSSSSTNTSATNTNTNTDTNTAPNSITSSSKVTKNSPYLQASKSSRRLSKCGKKSYDKNITQSSSPWEDSLFTLPGSSVDIGPKEKTNKNNNIHTDPLSVSPKHPNRSHSYSQVNSTTPYNNNHDNNSITKSTSYSENERTTSNNDMASILDMEKRKSIINNIKKPRSKSKSRAKDDSKKEIHKAAEQERRNRLNNALNELGKLLPDELKQSVTIPSKATTAELACIYIRELQDELQRLKK